MKPSKNVTFTKIDAAVKPIVPFVILAAEELERMKRDQNQEDKTALEKIRSFESAIAA